MKSYKTIIALLIILIILSILTYYVVFNEKTSSTSPRETGFAIKDTASIYKIVMKDKKNTVVLTRKGADNWLLNEKEPANLILIKTILETAFLVSVKSPVPESVKSQIRDLLSRNSIQVSFFDKNNRLIKEYYVGGQAGENGTYARLRDAKDPYIIGIDGFNGYLTTRFTTDTLLLKTRRIFKTPLHNLAQIEVQYTSGDSSYTLVQKQPTRWYIDDKEVTYNYYVQKGINYFRNGVAWLEFSMYPDSTLITKEKEDSILYKAKPFAHITFSLKTGEKYKVSFYWRYFRGVIEPSTYWSTINDQKRIVITQEYVFGHWLKSKKDMFKKRIS
ncbi:MAG: hypothetical protein NZ519_07985 [Bacteroidia bacterium]|nr:hypothetical protein [Bacteroidia bacterium]MDW8301504.1 hypothetical protein [Bacteroidia bacterium]